MTDLRALLGDKHEATIESAARAQLRDHIAATIHRRNGMRVVSIFGDLPTSDYLPLTDDAA